MALAKGLDVQIAGSGLLVLQVEALCWCSVPEWCRREGWLLSRLQIKASCSNVYTLAKTGYLAHDAAWLSKAYRKFSCYSVTRKASNLLAFAAIHGRQLSLPSKEASASNSLL